jgi:uncharacterized protein YjbJ (UPF0337 family)
MNWDRVEGNWKKFSGKVREQWGRLTDDDLDVIEGRRETLSGRIQEIYGISQDEAERQIKRFEDSLPDDRSNLQYDDSGARAGTGRNVGGNQSRDPRDSTRSPSR